MDSISCSIKPCLVKKKKKTSCFACVLVGVILMCNYNHSGGTAHGWWEVWLYTVTVFIQSVKWVSNSAFQIGCKSLLTEVENNTKDLQFCEEQSSHLNIF